ncbi:RalBP1-associated Eps domain-containing protein 1 [Halotydeus destructor]|nr:RalBP1-associated Eps domain-containing protein 1 [Halotydeus destructor]
MEAINVTFTDAEQRLFSDRFNSFEVDANGKVAVEKAIHFIRSSNLPVDVVERILELCGATRLGNFGRSQFYIALKLIGAAQAGYPLSSDTFKSYVIPLPQFSVSTINNETPLIMKPNNVKAISLSKNNQNINKSPVKTQLTQDDQRYISLTSTAQLPPPPQNKARTRRNSVNNATKPEVSLLPRPTSNSSHASSRDLTPDVTSPGENWSRFKEDQVEEYEAGFGPACDEGRPLVENGVDDDSDNSGEEPEAEQEDIWTLSDDQHEYYEKQFASVHGSPAGCISGPMAKAFFEKSKLPVSELSKIWQLSDVDKDGALNIEEFCVAMHLVVLRRNHVDLPPTLPDCLRRRALNYTKAASETTLAPSVLTVPSARTSRVVESQSSMSPAKTWTKFNSPTGDLLINIASPPDSSGAKGNGVPPVNFDFPAHSVDRDPRIVHPVAVRLTPEVNNRVTSSNESLTFHNNHLGHGNVPLQPPPRPTRKTQGHTRSSSLDLNHLTHPYASVPLAKVANLPANGNLSSLNAASGYARSGAFTLYRKPVISGDFNKEVRSRYGFPPDIPDPEDTGDTMQLKRTILKLRDRGKTLETMNVILMEELSVALESNRHLADQLSKLNCVTEH